MPNYTRLSVMLTSRAEPAVPRSGQPAWWLRALLVLQSPRAVFSAVRDDSDEAAHARQEPLTAILYLAGIAGVLATGASGRLLDNREFDGLLVAVWALFAGGIYALAAYWIGGCAVYVGAALAGSRGSYRRARHVLAFAAAPLALSLVAWPIRLAVHGGDVFRSGGADTGTGDRLFETFELATVAWSLVLLAIGIRAVHEWTWARTLAAVALPTAVPALLFARAYGLI